MRYSGLLTRGPRRGMHRASDTVGAPLPQRGAIGEQSMSTTSWNEHGEVRSALWHSENGAPAPTRIELADDTLTADLALKRLRAGAALLWRGDYPGARQLVSALGRRIDRRTTPRHRDTAQLFLAHRAQRAERARLLGGMLVELSPGHHLDLRRAPDVSDACREAYGELDEPMLVSLPELLGVLSAHQWQLKGVPVPALGASIHARYGVFSPVRSEYVDLVAEAPLPSGQERSMHGAAEGGRAGARGAGDSGAADGGAGSPASGSHSAADGGAVEGLTAFDLGTGTGVLSAVLMRRGVGTVVATDLNPRAVLCATENLERLGHGEKVSVLEADLYPEGRAHLVVCNPPWIPGAATSALELGVYDESSGMLRGFLAGLAAHLLPQGEGWLIISDLAEHLGLRTREELMGLIDAAGLEVVGSLHTEPRHPRAKDPSDLLHVARSKESTTLWRLRPVQTEAGAGRKAADGALQAGGAEPSPGTNSGPLR